MIKKIETKKVVKIALIVCMILMMTHIAISIYMMINVDLSSLIDPYKVDMGVDLFCMFLCLLLLYSCFYDDLDDINNRSLMHLIVVIGLAVFASMMNGFYIGHSEYRSLLNVFVTLEYLYDDLIVVAFWQYIYDYLPSRKKDKVLYIVSMGALVISILSTLLNCFLKYFFYIDPDGNLIENRIVSLYDLCGIAVFLAILVFICRSDVSGREKAVLLSFEFFPICGTIISAAGPKYSMVYPAYLLSVVLIYINVYQNRKKKIAEQENLLTKQNMALMISQIQPHFLYNTLTTISNMCVKDPEEAEETTVMFSRYLRGNLDSLRRTEPVKFPVELEHIQIYVELEQRRFGDRLHVTYDIQDMDFEVPSLGLQPIVENSIKHGICKKTEPGNLFISSKKTKDGHVVIIEDDGVGFDPDGPLPEDGRSHVGVVNVRSRLERMCGATMEVISSPGAGCRTVITFPDK